MVIYADVLFLENLLANCLILEITRLMSGCNVKAWRILLASVVGSIYAIMTAILPEVTFFRTMFIKIAASMLIAYIAFRTKNVVDYLKKWGMMLISTFILAGSTYALAGVLGGSTLTYAGFMYISPQGALKAFILAAGLCILLVRPIGNILSGRALREGSIVSVFINLGEKTTRINALVDTGNSLVDPLTGYPVMIVEAEALKGIIPADIYNWALNNKASPDDLLKNGLDQSWNRRLHLIPFKSVGRENGILTGFRPDVIKVLMGNDLKEIKDVIVGICGIKLSNNSRYAALLGPALLARG